MNLLASGDVQTVCLGSRVVLLVVKALVREQDSRLAHRFYVCLALLLLLLLLIHGVCFEGRRVVHCVALGVAGSLALLIIFCLIAFSLCSGFILIGTL